MNARLVVHGRIRVWFATGCILAASDRMVLAQTERVECATCHLGQASELGGSVHKGVVRCQDCHGGARDYLVSKPDAERWARSPTTTSAPGEARFDHGTSFRGKASRKDIPTVCGACHADVERMNPYGLLTDQLSSYWVSGHGKRLKQTGDTRVAVCIDCHGTHDVLRKDHPQSRTYFRNIPQTCARCHADRGLMREFSLSADVFDQYQRSVHGKNVLQRGDSGSPTCATCHGSHAAAPPGYLEVSHVCGRCHKQIEDYFLSSIHGRIPVLARCIGCHGKDGDRRNHEIIEASPPIDAIMQAYEKARAEAGSAPDPLRARFTEHLNNDAGALRLDVVCASCHSPQRRRDPHAMLFGSSDAQAREFGNELANVLRDAQFEYARAAERVERLGRGVLLLKDEALRAEDAKTEVMALTAFIHTLDREQIVARGKKVQEICQEVNSSLDRKEREVLHWRLASLPIWIFIGLFAALMYRKYLDLRREYVTCTASGGTGAASAGLIAPARRRLLHAALSAMGAVTLVALLWPAIAYVLPVRKRGGAADRVSAGKEEGWAAWEARKISVTGKPVVVVRSDKGFTAYSAICTHLGCIVHWDGAKREFECPCHAARFDAQGKVLAGPPPAPLPPYSASVVQGEVIVTPAKSS